MKDDDTDLWMYLRPCQFTIKTKKIWYLIESISPIAIIVSDKEICILNQNENEGSLVWIWNSIQGENYKVTNSLTDIDKDTFETLEDIVNSSLDWGVVLKIRDIYKIELKVILFATFISEFPNITELELTITKYNENKVSTLNILSEISRNLNIQININIDS